MKIEKITGIILIHCLFACFLSCSNNTKAIFYNKTFEQILEISKTDNSIFCIILSDSNSILSKEYLFRLQESYKSLTEKAIYNIVEINSEENEWYIKWLCPVSIPLTCVFSSEGILIDLIPGVSKETFLYSEEAIKNLEITEFHWPNQFNSHKKRLISILNNVLKYKKEVENGIYLSDELNQLTDSLNYPYSNYVRLIGELIYGDTVAIKNAAKSLIELESPYFLKLYRNEFITAKKILNPDFSLNDEPNIRVDKNNIFLSDCILNECVPVEVLIYNDGKQPLKISKVLTSCSCLEQINTNAEITINPREYYTACFNFTPDIVGDISRDIFINSNAINMPILYINLSANVLSNFSN